MSDIKRYTQGGIGMIYALDGEWVEYAAYVDLKRQLAEAKLDADVWRAEEHITSELTKRRAVTDEEILDAYKKWSAAAPRFMKGEDLFSAGYRAALEAGE